MDGVRVRKELPNTNDRNEEVEAEATPTNSPDRDGDNMSLDNTNNAVEDEPGNEPRRSLRLKSTGLPDADREDTNETEGSKESPNTDDGNNELDGEWIPDEFPVGGGDDESLNDVENIVEAEFRNGSIGGHHPEGINVSNAERGDTGRTEATETTSDTDSNASAHRLLAAKPTPSEFQLTNSRGGAGRTVQVAFARRSHDNPLFSFYVLDKDR